MTFLKAGRDFENKKRKWGKNKKKYTNYESSYKCTLKKYFIINHKNRYLCNIYGISVTKQCTDKTPNFDSTLDQLHIFKH